MDQFAVSFDDVTLRGDRLPTARQQTAIYLHGAGQSSRATCRLPRLALHALGLGSLSFDYIGHGETGGDLSSSSLKQRSRQLDQVLAAQAAPGPAIVFGTSMGAYDAIKLTERFPICSLVLIIPAVYCVAAFDVPFGSTFTAVIRQEASWRRSDAWELIGNFTGDLVIVTAEQDAVIPAELPARLYDCAEGARSRLHLQIPGATHRHLFSKLSDNGTLDPFMARIFERLSC